LAPPLGARPLGRFHQSFAVQRIAAAIRNPEALHLKSIKVAGSVAWYNADRLLEPLGYVPPAEFEQAFYDRQWDAAQPAVLT
jgi:transposase InsO family protein